MKYIQDNPKNRRHLYSIWVAHESITSLCIYGTRCRPCENKKRNCVGKNNESLSYEVLMFTSRKAAMRYIMRHRCEIQMFGNYPEKGISIGLVKFNKEGDSCGNCELVWIYPKRMPTCGTLKYRSVVISKDRIKDVIL